MQKQLPDDAAVEMAQDFELHLSAFINAYAARTNVSYWSLVALAFEVAHGSMTILNPSATKQLVQATAKLAADPKNRQTAFNQRAEAHRRINESGRLAMSVPTGSA